MDDIDQLVLSATAEQLRLVAEIYIELTKKGTKIFKLFIQRILSISTNTPRFQISPPSDNFIKFDDIEVRGESMIPEVIQTGGEKLLTDIKFDLLNNRQHRLELTLGKNIILKNLQMDKDTIFTNKQILESTKKFRDMHTAKRLEQLLTRNNPRIKPKWTPKIKPNAQPEIKTSTIPKGQPKIKINPTELAKNLGVAAALGAGFSVIVNIHQLMEGNYTEFGKNVGVGAVQSVVTVGLSEALNNSLGELAGPVASIIISTLGNTVGVIQSGDWERFFKNSGKCVIASSGGFGGAKLGACIGTFGGPIGTAVGGVVGGILGYLGTSFVVSKTPLSNITSHEIQIEKDKIITEKMKEINTNIGKKGLKLPGKMTTQEFTDQVKDGNLRLKYYEWADLQNAPSLSSQFNHLKDSIKFMFMLAKARSPIGDITLGLRLLLLDIRNL